MMALLLPNNKEGADIASNRKKKSSSSSSSIISPDLAKFMKLTVKADNNNIDEDDDQDNDNDYTRTKLAEKQEDKVVDTLTQKKQPKGVTTLRSICRSVVGCLQTVR